MRNKGGQQLGAVSDILLGSDRAKIEHIVLKREGGGEARVAPKQLSLGTGEKLMVDMPAASGSTRK